jgi:hypothetical protein
VGSCREVISSRVLIFASLQTLLNDVPSDGGECRLLFSESEPSIHVNTNWVQVRNVLTFLADVLAGIMTRSMISMKTVSD